MSSEILSGDQVKFVLSKLTPGSFKLGAGRRANRAGGKVCGTRWSGICRSVFVKLGLDIMIVLGWWSVDDCRRAAFFTPMQVLPCLLKILH